MLKKLVKHGNSSALVLDRNILALLGIKENSVLKLRIEGDTLLVKAADAVKPTDALMAEIESLHSAIPSNAVAQANEARAREYCENIDKDPSAMEALKEWEAGGEKANQLQKAFQEIMKSYQAELAILGGENFQNAIEDLTKQYKGDTSSKAFHEEVLALRLKHAPRLAEMDKEMEEAASALGMPSNPGL